mgnify:FL=1
MPNWKCTDWGPCINGFKERSCWITNGCDLYTNKPSTKMSCSPTSDRTSCDDGTPINKCSTNPANPGKYCNQTGTLVDYCTVCSCHTTFGNYLCVTNQDSRDYDKCI